MSSKEKEIGIKEEKDSSSISSSIPPESYSDKLTRRYVIASYIVMFVLVGVPLWIYTTSIYRAPLPYGQMDYYDKNIETLVDVQIPVYINGGSELPDIAEASQVVVDNILEQRGIVGWKLNLIQGSTDGGNLDYLVDLHVGDEDEYQISPYSRLISVSYSYGMLANSKLPIILAQVLLDAVFVDEILMFESYKTPPNKVISYSPQYHLTFSLFVEDGEAISWDIGQALREHFTPLRKELSRVANFTIDTQVQLYSSIACDFDTLQRGSNGAYLLNADDLSTFVNFAEWSLSSIHDYPTINFIVFVPSKDHDPLEIANSKSNSFLIPQWGGVTVLNLPRLSESGQSQPVDSIHLSSKDLLPILETISSQLFLLLGAPSLPKSPLIRIDILSRISSLRALITASSSLGSLHRLSQSLADIAIPKSVYFEVNDSLKAMDEALKGLRLGDWDLAVRRAGDAMASAQKAFFEKMMVQQVFFPEEHKIAVYLPLLGPVCVVLLVGFLRVVKEWRNDKLT